VANIKEIEGIGPTYGAKLESVGVNTEEKLLSNGASKSGRASLAEQTGISETLILNWVNRADLSRIKGIATQFADLLEFSGVDSVPELAQRNAANLTAKIHEVNAERNLVNRVPVESEVSDWIEQAKSLNRVVTH
jgi:predicted flap endonuclease-1-like 5' DNA nuclease